MKLHLLIRLLSSSGATHNYFEYEDCGEAFTNQKSSCRISEENGNLATVKTVEFRKAATTCVFDPVDPQLEEVTFGQSFNNEFILKRQQQNRALEMIVKIGKFYLPVAG